HEPCTVDQAGLCADRAPVVRESIFVARLTCACEHTNEVVGTGRNAERIEGIAGDNEMELTWQFAWTIAALGDCALQRAIGAIYLQPVRGQLSDNDVAIDKTSHSDTRELFVGGTVV